MAFESPLVAVLPPDPLFFRSRFRPRHHGGQYSIPLLWLGHHPCPLNSIVKRNSPYGEVSVPPGHTLFATNPPLDVTRNIKLSRAHTLHAPCDCDPCILTLNGHGGKTNYIQASTTAPIQGNSRNGLRPTRFQKSHACDVDILPALIGLTHDDFVYPGRIDATPLHNFVQH